VLRYVQRNAEIIQKCSESSKISDRVQIDSRIIKMCNRMIPKLQQDQKGSRVYRKRSEGSQEYAKSFSRFLGVSRVVQKVPERVAHPQIA